MRKISIYSGISTAYPFEERISAIKAAGFDEVCLDFEEEMLQTETSWENQVKTAYKYGLPVENAHLTWRNANSLWEKGELGDSVKNRVIDELRRTKELGIRTGVVHITAGFQKPDTDFELGLKRFSDIAENAEKFGIVAAFENSVFSEHVRYLFNHLQSGYVGFCFDSGHEHAFTPNEDYLASYGSRLAAMHLHDNDGKSDAHRIPFFGNIDWEKKVKELKNCPYFSDHITLECTIDEYPNLSEGFEKAIDSARRLCELADTMTK